MRRHRHSRPRHRVVAVWPSGPPDFEAIAVHVRYVGSPEHKRYPSPAGNPALRSDASECHPRYIDFEAITAILREGIRRGCIGSILEGELSSPNMSGDGWTVNSTRPGTSMGLEEPTRRIRLKPSSVPRIVTGV